MALRLGDTAPDFEAETSKGPIRGHESLQRTAKHQVATPVDWQSGEDVISVPSLSDGDARQRFPDGWQTLKSCLRVVPQPK
jgi:alkyl hydroperoxide reductase subunit AhpC